MTLAEQILLTFRGRRDTVAVANGTAFAPEIRSGGLTAAAFEAEHLAGVRCFGFYLVNVDNTVFCSCVDFDNKPDAPDPEWRAKAEQLYVVLTHCGLAPLVEISQSGNGCHVWIFFAEATPAWVPRAWWRSLARKIGAEFKEVYPRQDELAGKGIGNLVRYPLWNRSAFVDVENDWSVIDPCEALSGVRPTSQTDLQLLAFQLGLDELKPDPKAAIVVVEDIGEILPLRVQKLTERKGTLLNRRWNGDMAGLKDVSKSALAMSICTELVRQYVPTPEIASALRYWCRRNGVEAKGNRDDWIALTVSNAYEFTVQRIEQKSTDATTFQRACHAYLDLIEANAEKPLGSGISELDASIDGVNPGEVAVIAARPGHGKSALAFQWIDSAAEAGIAGLVISEEMSATEIGKRRLLTISNVNQKQWVPASVAHLREEVDEFYSLRAPVYVVENCTTIDRAEEVIDQFCSLHGVGIVAVDYLQLLGGRAGERYEIVTEISRRIKQCTRRNNVRTLLLSQLNREVEKRPDNEPKMSDLRESGGIEQDADLILFAQWPHKFSSDIPENEYRIFAAKRRNGPIREGKIVTQFDPERQRFGTIDPFACPM